jgi:hypothetical protein
VRFLPPYAREVTMGRVEGQGIPPTGAHGVDPWPDAVQVCVIGNFAKISSTRLNAFSAAACGVALS